MKEIKSRFKSTRLGFIFIFSIVFNTFRTPGFSCESMNGLPGPGNTQGHGVIERTADDHIVYWIEIDNSKGFADFDRIA